MSAASPAPALRTTTLIFGPFAKPLTEESVELLARAAAKSIGLGYAVLRVETETAVKIVAVQSAPRSQPFTRVRELVPGAVITALVGDATAQEA